MIIIGDVHGCYNTLMALVEQLPKDEELCFVGDLIDRGPMSKQVVEFVKNNKDRKIYCVKGNHEDMMVQDGQSPFIGMTHWYTHNGGKETLESYDADNPELFKEHIEWMRTLPIIIEFTEIKNEDGLHLIVSHSSAGIDQIKKDELNILWSRDNVNKAVSRAMDRMPLKENQFNIFGHTVQNKPRIGKNWACIDTGAVFIDPAKRKYEKQKYGKMTAIQFPSMKIYQQENID